MRYRRQTDQDTRRTASKPLQRRIFMSRIMANFEQIVAAFWGFGISILAIAALIRWTSVAELPVSFVVTSLLVLAVTAMAMFWRGLRRFRFPDDQVAIERLDAKLPSRPVSALFDELAMGSGNDNTKEMWRLHLSRMEKKAAAAEVAPPKIRLAKRDPFALRLIALLAVFSAALFANGTRGTSIIEQITGEGGAALAGGPSFEAWAEPPIYTGQPTVYLNEASSGKVIALPEGTQITIRVYGEAENARFAEDVSLLGLAELPASEADVLQFSVPVQKSGVINLDIRSQASAEWVIDAIPDAPPSLELTGELTRNIDGALQLPFKASDDYGVIGGQMSAILDLDRVNRRYGLALAPEDHPEISADMPLPFNGDTSEFEEVLIDNQAKHPWAGLPVTMEMDVRDDAGNVTAIEPLEAILPGKRFFDPFAAALIDIRRELLWNRENAKRAAYLIKAVTYRAETLRVDESAYLAVRTALRRLEYNKSAPLSDTVLADVAELLWKAAVEVEEGDLNDAKERLKRAQERLSEAMENGATDEEIAELMDELREATRDYMRHMAENAEEGENQQANNNSQTMSQDQIQEMMDRIQELMEQGRMAEAQELLQQLQELLENMRVVRQDGQQGEDGQQELQDSLRQQQELADETFRELQEEFERERQQQQQGQQGQQGQQQQGQQQNGQQPGDQPQNEGRGQQQGQSQQQGGQQQQDGRPSDQRGQGQGQAQNQQNGQGPGGNQSTSDLAGRQEALRQMLNEQRGGVPNDGSEAGRAAEEALRRAERAMGEARDELEEGDASGALDRQAEAMDALREGMRQLGEQGRQAQGGEGDAPEQSGDGPPQSAQDRALDPLGREQGNGSARSNLSRNRGLDQQRSNRAREVFEELRERSNDRARPQLELDYLDRLLDRF